MFDSLVWLTSNHMFGSDNFWDKSPLSPSFYSGNSKFLKNALGQFIKNHPSKHVMTSTNTKQIWAN